MVWKPNSLCYC